MDRQIVYPGQIPLETDLLNTNRNTMIALGKLAGAILGTGGIVNGLAVAPTSPASLSVSVGAGEIYQLANVDDTAYSSLPADTTDTVVKQGILLQAATLSCPAPSTSGFSIDYLIEAKFEESDTGSVVLPYYNASNPQQAYSGPNNTGAAQAVTRAGTVSLQAKAGIAATTGTQTAPTVDAGYIALAVVTVANGQSTITSGNIVAQTTGQLLASPVSKGRLLNVQVFSTPGTFTYTPTPGTNSIDVYVQGAGGSGGGTAAADSTHACWCGGGGSGAFGRSLITSGFSGVSVTVGAGGVGAAGAAGGNGGSSSFGAFVSAPGGNGAPAQTQQSNVGFTGPGGGGSTASGGTIINSPGIAGAPGCAVAISGVGISGGNGGGSIFGAGQTAPTGGSGSQNGFAATVPGTGGSGAVTVQSGSSKAGGNGAPGLVIIHEYA